ncbi:GerAB/ArcD/ProY family transporter [Virgibacillus siamensis]|uniref:GerAB/ArcD/ProY family transporter n=1 Tax=Virgibacillus siamensis TaxID=480071 RepID=UPI00158CAE1A|nr:endospore germination permease [Virgibacillus siamensis]
MIEKGRISGVQMAILMYPAIMATAILLVPAISGKFARHDMWMSPIWASLAGFMAVYIACQLNKRFPGETVIQYSGEIIGRIPGKLIGFIILFFYLQTNGVIIREYSEFVVGNFLPTTPQMIVNASIVLVCGMAVQGGIEVMARSAQIFVPVVVILFLFIIVLLIPTLEPRNIFPIMENGIMPSVMGSIVPGGWFAEFFLLAFLLPLLGKGEKPMKWGMITVLLVMLTLTVVNFISLALFGNLTSTFTYPFMNAVRYISIAEFLQHLESIVMAIWVAGTFVKVSVFYYAIVLGTAQWLGLSDYRPIVFPIGFLLVIMNIWSAENLQELTHFISTSWTIYSFFVQLLVPVLLLIVACIWKKRAKGDAGK